MSTTVTWNGTSYSIPASGELNWSALSNFLIDLGQHAAATTFDKRNMRVATTSPVTVSASTDTVVLTHLGTPGAVAVNLPAGADGQMFYIGDQLGDAATNNITINRNGSDTINGATTYVIKDNYGGVILAYAATNTQWNVVGRFTSGVILVNPMATTGDMIYGGASGVATNLATGATAGVLHGGNAAVPSWSTIVNADISGSAAIVGSKLVVTTDGSAVTPVSTTTQTFAGAKTFSSAVVVGGNTTGDSNLGTIASVSLGSYYAGSFTATFDSVGFNATQSVTVLYTKIGRLVTLEFPGKKATASGTGTAFIAGTGTDIPSVLRPQANLQLPVIAIDNNADVAGGLNLITTGAIRVYRSVDFATNYTTSSQIGWERFAVSYIAAS